MPSKYTTIHYHSYLDLDKVLDAQHPRSLEKATGKPAHDELLFIITHQAYELWFKQIIHELESVHAIFKQDNVKEKDIGNATHRIQRVTEILKLLIQQIHVLETMTPLDFLDFRDYLFPASGFQSYQFRVVETLLGLKNDKRITYNSSHYASVFPETQQTHLLELEQQGSLVERISSWLERTPFIQYSDFEFFTHYNKAVKMMLEKEQTAIQESPYLNEKEKEMRLMMLGNSSTYFASVLSPDSHAQLKKEGKIRFSYQATVGALLINLYRDEPILRMPFMLLNSLMDVDEHLTTWRYRHAQMVLRMLGRKIGTGGSSGYDYLAETAIKHPIFTDLYTISTMLIPRSQLPPLPKDVEDALGFFYK
jgi:tryptophan 2,3-dioxygenase